jgi:hemolysin activation/secretion protein
VPGLRLKSTLARGKTLGGALLVLEGTHRLVSAGASIDNHLPPSLGTWSYGANIALNSVFGFGEQFYASAHSGGEHAHRPSRHGGCRVFRLPGLRTRLCSP